MSSSSKNKPWRGKNKKIQEDNVIKKISKSWNQNDWDSYLADAGFDKPKSEYEVLYSTYLDLTNKSEVLEKPSSKPKYDLTPHIKKLEVEEKVLMHLLYWENRTFLETSKIINKSLYKVKKLKNKTLTKLKKSIQKDKILMEAYNAK